MRVLDNAHTVIVEFADSLHHAGCFDKWTVEVILREGVLLEELVLDDLSGLNKVRLKLGGSEVSYLKNGLLVLGERIFTNKLHNFDEFVLLLQNLAELGLERHEFRLDLGVVVFQDAIVGREGKVPVDGGEMLSFG